MTCKCAKRLAKLERDVTRLRAQLPTELHHAVRHELQVELKKRAKDRPAAIGFHMLGSDSYSDDDE